VGGPLAAVSRALAGLVVALLMLPSAAYAQGRGVFVDPESPAGNEYAIPLEEARRQAAGEEQRGAGEGRASGAGGQPLFGAGIERVPGESPTEGTSRGDGGRSGARPRDNGADRDRQTSAAGEDQSGGGRSVAVEAAAKGGSDALITAAMAGLVLVGGLGVGFGLRRLLRTE
jgi:hypothetical protein